MQVNCLSISRITRAAACCATAIFLLHLNTSCGGSKETAEGGARQDSMAGGEFSTVTTAPAATTPAVIRGKVIETRDADRYTYIWVQTSGDTVWAAGPVAKVEVGEEVVLSTGMLMKDFYSKSLDRTFETIYFVGSFDGPGKGGIDPDWVIGRAHGGRDVSTGRSDPEQGGSEMPGGGGSSKVARKIVGDFEKAAGGQTVAEIYAGKEHLAGQTVKVRGVVVKFTPGIMGTNWVHLQDGTGAEGSHDLTVTTDATVKVGDLVTIKGVLSLDKDFGAGYSYEVIVERAELIAD